MIKAQLRVPSIDHAASTRSSCRILWMAPYNLGLRQPGLTNGSICGQGRPRSGGGIRRHRKEGQIWWTRSRGHRGDAVIVETPRKDLAHLVGVSVLMASPRLWTKRPLPHPFSTAILF